MSVTARGVVLLTCEGSDACAQEGSAPVEAASSVEARLNIHNKNTYQYRHVLPLSGGGEVGW